eukprot:4451049-Pyramimonas_sp.AAC.1
MECFCLSDHQYSVMGARLAKLGRIATCGGASWMGPTHPKSLANKRVLDFWKVAPCKLELRARRLSWYQSWARFPEAGKQIWAVRFSLLDFEPGNFDPCEPEHGLSNY